MDHVLTTYGLSKEYGKFTALRGLSLCVPKGSIYGLVGKNGSGKTTFIRIVCGLQQPSGGSYSIFGESYGGSASRLNAARKRMGAVVETPSIYGNLTAEQNLIMQCRILGVPDLDRVKSILKLVGLHDTGTKKAKNFSLGMKQRLGIAVALCGDPDLLILDEPINGLDPQGIVEVRELILRLNRENGISFIISSHILDELSRLATYYGFIDGGEAVKEMSAADLDAACRKRTCITVTDASALTRYFDKNGYEYEVIGENKVDVFAVPNITQLVKALDKDKCEVLSVSEKNENLEGFFIDLVGGEVKNA